MYHLFNFGMYHQCSFFKRKRFTSLMFQYSLVNELSIDAIYLFYTLKLCM